LDCGSLGLGISLPLMPSTDLKYFSMIERSLEFGTLLVMMAIPPEQGQMNSEHIEDLIFFSRVLI